MKNKRIKIMVIAIGVLILLMGIIYRNTYIVKNDRIVIKEMSESTQVSDLNSSIDRLNTEHDEYKRYVENSKAQIAQAITFAGVDTEGTDSFETMASNIKNIARKSGISGTFAFNKKTINLGFKPSCVIIKLLLENPKVVMTAFVDIQGLEEIIFYNPNTDNSSIFKYLNEGYIVITDNGFEITNYLSSTIEDKTATYYAY